MILVEYLADHLHLAPRLAALHHEQWGRLLPHWSADQACAELAAHTRRRAIPTTLVALDAGALGPDGLALRLRVGAPSVITRVSGGRVLLDPRTLPEESFPSVAAALAEALRE